MKIKTIKLNKFKRFDNLTINLGENPKKVVVLVGPNGCGKSSVFDAFEFKLKDHHNFGEEGVAFYYKGMYTGLEDGANAYNKNTAVTITNDQTGNNLDVKSFYVRTAYRFTSKLNVTNIRTQQEVIKDARPISSIALDNRLTSNYERLICKAYEDFNTDGTKTGNEVKEQLIGRINKILESILDIKISSLGNVINEQGTLYFDKENTKDFPYANLSAGEKEIVDLVLDLIIKTEVYTNTVFCIDEPELHLNTKIQRSLLIELEKLIPENCQLWIATHSIGFLRAIQEELSSKTQILNFGETDFFQGEKNIAPMLQTRNNWQLIFQTALDDLTHLIAPKRIVYCEGHPHPAGEGGEQGLDAIVYNYVFQEAHTDTLFVSAAGGDLVRNSTLAIQIINKAFNGVELLRFKDRDEKSNSERTIFLGESSLNRMTERREIENYLFDKEVLLSYCDSTGVVFDEEKYNTYVTDVRTQDLKLVKQHIQHSCKNRGLIGDFMLKLKEHISKGGLVYTELEQCVFLN